MWIQQTKTGYRMYDRYTDLNGKTHKVSVPLDRDTAQARRKAQEELTKLIADKSMTVSEMPLKSLVELYLSHKDVKPSTMVNYENAFNQIQEALGNITIDKITAPFILRQFSQIKKPQSTINRYIMLLNNMLDWAHQYGYISEHIHIKPGKIKEQKRDPELEYLESSELKDVLDQMEGTMDYYVCKFLALTGCRIGEAAALTLSDLDDKYIHITKAYKIENGVSTPKTAHSTRDIFIQPELRTFLKEYQKWRKTYMMAYGIRTDLLFFSMQGTYINSMNMRVRMSKIKCKKHLHPHIFRHTHVALLAEQGLSLEAIARRLGHSDSAITKKIYFHVTEKLKERDEIALSKISFF